MNFSTGLYIYNIFVIICYLRDCFVRVYHCYNEIKRVNYIDY